MARIKLKNNDRSNYIKILNLVHQKAMQKKKFIGKQTRKIPKRSIHLIHKTFMQTDKKTHKNQN